MDQAVALPRKNTGLAMTAVIIVGVLGLVMPVLLLFAWSQSGNNPLNVVRSGPLMLLVPIFLLFGPILVGVLGAFMARGSKIPPIAFLVTASFPFVISVLSGFRTLSLTVGAISGESVDPSQKARIIAGGLGESMNSDFFGGLVAGGIAIACAAACCAAVATIAGPTPHRPTRVIVSGALWFFATFVVGVLRFREPGLRAMTPILIVITLVPFAIAAARQANALTQWNDKAEAERIASGLVIALVAALVGVLLVQRAFEASVFAPGLTALEMGSLDPSQRMRVLAEAAAGVRLGPAAYAVHAIFGSLTFGFALAPLFGNGPDGSPRSPINGSAIAAFVIGLVLVALSGALTAERRQTVNVLDRVNKVPAGITLPHTPMLYDNRANLGFEPHQVEVPKSATATPLPAKCSGSTVAEITADKDATMGALRFDVLGAHCSAKTSLKVSRDVSPEETKLLGNYAKLLSGSDGLPFELDAEPPKAMARWVEVESVDAGHVKINGKPSNFPFDVASPVDVNGDPDAVVYVFRSQDSVAHMVDVITMFERASHLHFEADTASTKRYVTSFL